ncbi:MAG: glutathione S-transferase family protein [Gammaproteobacteria bacterium]|nr:glutathione S-transferase family protein [Gammaproteobacteria bacterium]
MKLYGFPMSNYYNMVKIALLEKGIAFEEVTTMPNQEPDFLAKSPMGKVPCLETSNGLLTESSAILEYIEEWEDGTALLPTDREERAKVRSMCRTMELYIELSARRLYPQVFFGAAKDAQAVAEARPLMERAIVAINATARFNPYIGGTDFSLADIVGYETFGYAAAVASAIYDWDIIGAVDGLKASRDAIAARPSVQQVDAAQNEAMAAFQAEQAKA